MWIAQRRKTRGRARARPTTARSRPDFQPLPSLDKKCPNSRKPRRIRRETRFHDNCPHGCPQPVWIAQRRRAGCETPERGGVERVKLPCEAKSARLSSAWTKNDQFRESLAAQGVEPDSTASVRMLVHRRCGNRRCGRNDRKRKIAAMARRSDCRSGASRDRDTALATQAATPRSRLAPLLQGGSHLSSVCGSAVRGQAPPQRRDQNGLASTSHTIAIKASSGSSLNRRSVREDGSARPRSTPLSQRPVNT